MVFRPQPMPAGGDAHLQAVKRVVQATFENIATELQPQQFFQMAVAHVEPPKPRQGMLVYADGADFDPGSGEGLYRHDGSAWVFIG